MIGAVLCGGRSTRMGTDKATMVVAGRPMASWVAGALRAGGADDIVALGGSPAVEALGFEVVHDRPGMEGPLAALVAGLGSHAEMFVCPCDVPALDPVLVSDILRVASNANTAATLAHSGRLEPLIGVYSVAALEILERGWAAGARGPKMALRESDITTVAAAPTQVRNVNTPGDIQAVTELLENRPRW